MEALGLVLLKSAAWLTGFALVYLLVLRNERYFRLNRLYLLAGIAASLLFPFYTFHYTVVIPFIQTSSATVDELIPGGVISEETTLPFYFWIYLAGITVVLLRLLFQTWKIIRKLKESGYEQTGSVKLVRTSEYASSFSFFSYVFVNPSTATSEMEVIMNHEREHIQQRHWLDLLLVEFICIVQWFNPFAWIYVHLVRQNHEYLADEQALRCTVDPVIYQAALLNQLLGAPVFSLTNSFSYSLNKKRFSMMKKKIESPFRKLKILVVLPLVAMLFYAFAAPEYQYGNENNSVAPEGKTMDVKGQVLKSDGNPLHGTSVILRGSTMGTITDQDGNFLLKGIPADGELVFSFVGFKTVVQKVISQPMKIVMEVEKVGIDQVVVTAYGTPPPPPLLDLAKWAQNENPPLIFLDGKIITMAELANINRYQIESISVLKDKSATAIYGEKGKNGVILISTKAKAGSETGEKSGNEEVVVVGYGKTPSGETTPPSKVAIRAIDSANPPLYILNGVPITKSEMEKIDPDQIASINVIKDKSATDSYGVKATNGVILIVTKDKASNIKQLFGNYSEQMVEEMPQFPGGQKALNDFFASVIVYPAEAVKNNIQGRVMVTFTVNSDGKVGNAKISKGVHPLLDNEAIRVVNLSPAWEPGKNKGLPVTASYTIPVVFALDAGRLDKNRIVSDPVVSPQRPDGVFVVVEEMPEFPGGNQALKDFIGSNVKYPEAAKKEGIQGKVFVNFVVKSDGTLGNFKVVRGVHPLLDKEALRVVTLLPTWKPGKQRGQAVNVSYTIPIQFAPDGDKNAKQDLLLAPSPKVPIQRPDGVFVVVEEMPEFPGGELALRTLIGRSIKYPADAIKDSIQGKVFVTFVVKSDGTVGDAKIARGVHPLLDNEAIRVIDLLPAWKPGKQRGEAVSVSYTVPVQFALKNGLVKQKVSFVPPKVNEKEEKQVFIVVEEMPEFPGGSIALRTFIANAIEYPTDAQKDKIQGKVFVSFVVSSEGKVEQAKVERSVSPSLDAEAIRVVNSLPDWKPGKQRGQAVSVAYTIPIEFKLQ